MYWSLLVTEGTAFLASIAIALSDKEVSKESAFKARSMGAKKNGFFFYHSNTAASDVKWVLKFQPLLMFSKRMYWRDGLFGVDSNSALR